MATRSEATMRKPAQPPRLLMTKVRPPVRRDQTVARERLVERLRHTPGIKLTVVAAPAGSGKTTLLGTWQESEMATRPVAWLSLDEGDDDPVVLWSYVLAALQEALPVLEVSSSPERLGAARIVDTLLPELINELINVGDAALVLDDFHLLSNNLARNSIGWFIDHVPPTFQLVLATRSEPALSLAALRAHGTLVEVRAAQLNFTPAEAELLLNDRFELSLEPEYVDDLVARTEGWPAGLYLAALSLQAADDRQALVSRFGGENRHVVDFLVDEVLEASEPATQSLMLRSSVLERLSGPLCDAVLEQRGSTDVLRALSRSNLFLIPLDERGGWYRFHHLFAQLLRAELEHREPGLAAVLHRRAFEWHRENGSVDEAIQHALAAGLFADAGELIARAWVRYVEYNRFATILAWLDRFPSELLREEPSLLLVQAWVHSLRGAREPAARAIAAIERLGRSDGRPLPDGFSSVEASLTTLRGLISWGDTRGGLEHARRGAQLEGPESPWRPVVSFAVGAGLYFRGDFEEAERWLMEAVELGLSRQRWETAATAVSHWSLVAGELGRHEQQTSLAEQAVEFVLEHGLEAVDGEAFVALGAALAARERFDEAVPLLERGVAIVRSRGHPRVIADGLIRQAAALQAVDSRQAAAGLIAEARMIVDSCPDPGMLEERLAALERPRRPQHRVGEATLSDRELRILRMLGGSLSERDIARELYLSHNTVHSHTKSIYRKLGVSSRSEALTRARELGLI